MISADAKTHQRLGALMQRVLIVDPLPASTRLLSDLLRDICHCQIWAAADGARGMALAGQVDPHIILVEHGAGLDGAAFARHLRRSDFSCRKAPMIMISSEATAAAIIGARDAGVHEFLRKPFTIKDLLRRLEAVALRSRDWVEGIGYVGPDRRRFNSGDYAGPLKRRVDHAETPDQARIVQALKILKSALGAIERDPHQALRAMLAQTDDITAAATDAKLRAAADVLGRRLAALAPAQLRRADLEPLMAAFWDYLPGEDSPGRTAAA